MIWVGSRCLSTRGLPINLIRLYPIHYLSSGEPSIAAAIVLLPTDAQSKLWSACLGSARNCCCSVHRQVRCCCDPPSMAIEYWMSSSLPDRLFISSRLAVFLLLSCRFFYQASRESVDDCLLGGANDATLRAVVVVLAKDCCQCSFWCERVQYRNTACVSTIYVIIFMFHLAHFIFLQTALQAC